jgi:hypothetical protein
VIVAKYAAGTGLGVKATVLGAPEIIDALRGVKYGVGNRGVTLALRKQAGKAAKIAKANLTAHRTGLLKKAIGWIYRKPKRSNIGGGAFVVGARASVSAKIEPPPGRVKKFVRRVFSGKPRKGPKLSKRTIKKYAGLLVRPYRYAHLVEGGRPETHPRKARIMASGRTAYGRQADAVKARPFMKPASDAIQRTGANEVKQDLEVFIHREAAKYSARGKSIYGVPGT